MVWKTYRKYNNKKTVLDGITFDSISEAARYSELKLLQKACKISNLECHPRFLLQEGFNDLVNGNVRYRPIHFSADFKYRDNETLNEVIEDVKSKITAKEVAYNIRKRLFRAKYPQYIFREVTS